MSKSARSVFAHSAATLVGTAVGALSSVAYVSLGARWLGPAEYGKVGATLSIANLFFLALNPLEAGMTLQVARFAGTSALADLRGFLAQSLRGLMVLGFVIFSAGLALLCALRATWNFGSADAALWLGVFCVAALVCCGPRAGLRGREMFGVLAVNIVLESAVRMMVGLGLLALLGGAGSMLAGYAMGMLAAIAHGEFALRARLPAPEVHNGPTRLRDDAWLPLRTLSAPLLGLNLYSVLAANIDVLAAARFLDPRRAGLYAGAASLARMVPVAANPLLLVFFSRLAAQSAARENTSGTMRLGALWIASALGLSLLAPAFGGELLLRLFLGTSFAEAHDVLFYQWATACVLTGQLFFVESMLATARARSGWIFVVPALSVACALFFWHGTALTIARTTLYACAASGSLTCLVLWRGRRP